MYYGKPHLELLFSRIKKQAGMFNSSLATADV
jgi:hypothetical protein